MLCFVSLVLSPVSQVPPFPRGAGNCARLSPFGRRGQSTKAGKKGAAWCLWTHSVESCCAYTLGESLAYFFVQLLSQFIACFGGSYFSFPF